MPIRSLLYTPGNEPGKVAKAGGYGADAVILDLEDAVPLAQKVAARAAVRGAIPAVKAAAGRVYVRINPLSRKTGFSAAIGAQDIESVACPELDGVVVPKVESAGELAEVDRILGSCEVRLGIPPGSIKVLPIIETALGLWNAYDIARSIPRVGSLHFGAGDFTRDLNLEWSREETELLYARSRLVVVCRAAGREPPTDTVWVRLDDDEGLAASAQRARGLGLQGKCCIHPRQVRVVNGVFSFVPPEELARARRIVEAFREAEARSSASIQVDGQFVDYPLVEKAKQLLERHARAQGQSEGD
jgi:citrate lyase subunit beta/citryl-CoA lyase